jgi:hypothetical protein
LVCDYYEDIEHPNLIPDDHVLHIARELMRRQLMDYYVSKELAIIDNEVARGGEHHQRFLQEITDAVGYLVRFEREDLWENLRIMASVRCIMADQLHVMADHGLPGRNGDRGPRRPLDIEIGSSVLGTCAKLGVPLFGRVIEEGGIRKLDPDPKCLKLLREEEARLLDRGPILYQSCGRQEPRYEFALPLVFGSEVLGTLDLEFFAAEKLPKEADITLAHELPGLLEWARAISLCLAWHADAKDEKLQRIFHRYVAPEENFQRFKRLCAQIVANVRIPAGQTHAIAAEYFRELVPVNGIHVEPIEFKEAGDLEAITKWLRGQPIDTRLRFRGRPLGTIALQIEDPETGLEERPFHSLYGPGGIVRKLMASHFASSLLSEEVLKPGWSDSAEFIEAIGHIRTSMKKKFDKLEGDPDLDAGVIVQTVFETLHQSLRKELTPDRGQSTYPQEPGRYAWFLYLASFDSDSGQVWLECGKKPNRWACADTEEMRRILSPILVAGDAKEKSKKLQRIIREARRREDEGKLINKDQLNEKRRQVPEDQLLLKAKRAKYAPRILLSIITELLVREYDLSSPATSLTREAAKTGDVLSAIDFNLSPLRSPRRTGWFWKGGSYSIIAMPIVFAGRSIGVLNFLRRRTNRDDLTFFKGEEIEEVRRFKEFVTDNLERLIEYLPFPVTDLEADWSVSMGSIHRLREAYKKAHQNGTHVLGVEYEFVSFPQDVETICRLLDETIIVYQNGDLTSYDSPESVAGTNVAISLSSIPDDPKDRERRERALKRIISSRKGDKWLLVFFRRQDRELMMQSLRLKAADIVTYRENEEEIKETFTRFLAASLEERNISLMLLRLTPDFAEEGDWKAKMINDLKGENSFSLQRRLILLLDELLDSRSNWRPYPGWLVYSSPEKEASNG